MKHDKDKPLTYKKPEWARQELVNLNHDLSGFTDKNQFRREDPPKRSIDWEKFIRGVAEPVRSESSGD